MCLEYRRGDCVSQGPASHPYRHRASVPLRMGLRALYPTRGQNSRTTQAVPGGAARATYLVSRVSAKPRVRRVAIRCCWCMSLRASCLVGSTETDEKYLGYIRYWSALRMGEAGYSRRPIEGDPLFVEPEQVRRQATRLLRCLSLETNCTICAPGSRAPKAAGKNSGGF